jgi:hypothetical protein
MSTITKLRNRVGTGLATAGLVTAAAAAGLAVASPAQAACASDYRYTSIFSSYAEAHTEDCSYWSNSYARHGGVAIWSGWYSGSSWASASSGVSFSYYAANYFA